MEKEVEQAGKKLYSVQVHIIHSLIYMVGSRLKASDWMNERDLVEANAHYFQKMAEAVERHYRLNCTLQHAWGAARLYLDYRQGREEVSPPANPESFLRPEGEDTFWQDYERIYRLDPDRYE
ncbi:hypothetical protein [Dyadobacter tibetensis]|uniref:hypothetical protein n=1 Tax=Dyadobacter tibetensis TaxID=1211851 RepID=UPI0004724FE9|nr:hypothetical protein [Dyadobacter tibetensis]